MRNFSPSQTIFNTFDVLDLKYIPGAANTNDMLKKEGSNLVQQLSSALNQIVFDPFSSHCTIVVCCLHYYENKSQIYPAGLVKVSFCKIFRKAGTKKVESLWLGLRCNPHLGQLRLLSIGIKKKLHQCKFFVWKGGGTL